ncbi:MAG: tetratricopeptide repeat protein [Paracoccaceae bacterium]
MAALLSLTVLLAGCKTASERAEELVTNGAGLERRGAYEAARQSYSDALAADPDSIAARKAVARLDLARDRYDAALKQYRALHERLSEDVETNLALAELALRDFEPERAAEFVAIAEKGAPDDPRTKGDRAAVDFYAAASSGDPVAVDKAVAALRAAIDADPKAFAARVALVQWMARGTAPLDGLPLIEAGLRIGERRLDLQMLKLFVLQKAGDDRAATAHLKDMYKEFPDNWDLQAWLGDYYRSYGDTDEAVAFFLDRAARMPEAAPDDAALRALLSARLPPATAAARMDAVAEGLGTSRRAARFRAGAARIRFDLGDRAASLAVMLALTAEGTPLARSPNELGLAAAMLESSGRAAEAERMLDRVLAIDPTVWSAVAGKARALVGRKDHDGAIALLRPAAAGQPPNPQAMILLADVYVAAGLPELAQEQLGRAYAASGKGVAETLKFATLLQQNGHRDVALRVIGEALEVHPDDPDLAAVRAALGTDVSP